jgi:eukaryotic-like serine/threonine-protein kinase
MSPEQAAGKNVDARSDIFSFGTTLYEMVTGRRPFQGDTKMSTLAAIIHHEPPPPSEFAGALPPELEKIIARCLRKDPERRAQHMDDVKLAIEELKEESESGKTATAVRQSRSAVFRYVAVAAGAVIAGAAAFWFVANYLQRVDAAIYQLRPITRDEARSFNPALSPDGKLLVYSSDRAGGNNVDLWLQQVAGGEPMRLTRHPARETDARFSADGSQIVFVRAGAGVYTIPALGGTERLIVKEGSNPSYSPDGQWIAYTTGYPGSRELYGPDSRREAVTRRSLVRVQAGTRCRTTAGLCYAREGWSAGRRAGVDSDRRRSLQLQAVLVARREAAVLLLIERRPELPLWQTPGWVDEAPR